MGVSRMKRAATLGFVIQLVIVVFFVPSASAGVIMQGFYWDAQDPSMSWYDKMAKNANQLKTSGFTAIWIPPVHKGDSGGYSNGYDPFDDYDIGSKDQKGTVGTRWGTREQLQRAVAVMRANGLDVYVDLVLNHRNGDDGNWNFFIIKTRTAPLNRAGFKKGIMTFIRVTSRRTTTCRTTTVPSAAIWPTTTPMWQTA